MFVGVGAMGFRVRREPVRLKVAPAIKNRSKSAIALTEPTPPKRTEKREKMISFEDFAKIELRVGKIKEATRVENSEKLLKLQVDLGEETKQILAGIGKVYEPANLIGKEVIVVANLEPRSMMGEESQGMLLAASSPEGPVVLSVEKEVAPGAKIS